MNMRSGRYIQHPALSTFGPGVWPRRSAQAMFVQSELRSGTNPAHRTISPSSTQFWVLSAVQTRAEPRRARVSGAYGSSAVGAGVAEGGTDADLSSPWRAITSADAPPNPEPAARSRQ